MSDLCRLIWCALIGPFRSRAALEAEILALRHQLNVLRRKSPKRLAFGNIDRLVFVSLYRVAPGVLDALKILKPQTVIRWHRAGFRTYWRWKSRSRGGRPKTPADICQLIRDMSLANPLWGAPRIHGELLKLGIDVGQTSVAKYMARRRGPPSQGWKTFLRNHADGIAAMDLFVVPTISFRLLYGLLILRHDRRRILWMAVTAHPTAEWIAHQLVEACGWEQAPGYIVRDRDCAYGEVFIRRVRAMGIRDRPVAAVTVAKWICGTSDRLDPKGMRRPCRGAWGTAPSSPPAVVHEIPQRSPDTFVTEQRCADPARCPGGGPHSLSADFRRIASSLQPDLISGRHKRLFLLSLFDLPIPLGSLRSVSPEG